MDEVMKAIVNQTIEHYREMGFEREDFSIGICDEIASAAIDKFVARGLITEISPEIEGWWDEVMIYLKKIVTTEDSFWYAS